MRERLVTPFLRVAPWVAQHPTARKFPPGFRCKNAHSSRSLDCLAVFCTQLQGLQESYPALFCPEDDAVFAPCFALWAQRD